MSSEYKVSFIQCSNNEMKSVKLNKYVFPVSNKGYTYCFIYSVNGAVVAQGRAVCSKEDNFNRAVGRKISFKRAVEVLSNKSDRKALWDWFKKESPKSFKKIKYGRTTFRKN